MTEVESKEVTGLQGNIRLFGGIIGLRYLWVIQIEMSNRAKVSLKLREVWAGNTVEYHYYINGS